jgi:hypothetical protein
MILGNNGFIRRRLPAAASWWLSGGISSVNAIGVYQPIGAASLAASYTNLANPGTYDAAPGVAPTWASGTGWEFTAASSQYLTTGIVVPDTQTWSLLVRFSDRTTNGYLLGSTGTSGSTWLFGVQGNNGSNRRSYGNGASVTGASGSAITGGVLGFAGRQGYYNGSPDGDEIGTTYTHASLANFIGARNLNGSPNTYQTVTIQAVAIYDTTLTGAQVLAVSNAMASL